MRQEGNLDLTGISNVDRATARRALEFVDVAAIQNGYNITDRPNDEMVEFARDRAIAYVPFFPPLRPRVASTERFPAPAAEGCPECK